jgi:hypothetical protein
MTNEELDKLDVLAAEKVMGWFPYEHKYREWLDGGPGSVPTKYCLKTDDMLSGSFWWQPTRRIEHAWELLKETGLMWRIEHEADYFCMLFIPDGDKTFLRPWAKADTLPLAIVLACLRAKGVNVEL